MKKIIPYFYCCLLFGIILSVNAVNGQTPIQIEFGENLIENLPTEASSQSFTTPEVLPGDVLFIKVVGSLKLNFELFPPQSAESVLFVSGSFSNDIEVIYEIPSYGTAGEYTILVSNNGIWTGDFCIILERMNEPPTAVHLNCESSLVSELRCDSDIRSFKYMVFENSLSRITVNGTFAAEAWVCSQDGEILRYNSGSFNQQIILDSIPAVTTGCYYVFVSDNEAQWDNEFSISHTTLSGECASMYIESDSDSDEVCEGGTITLTATSPLPDISYSWEGPDGFVFEGAQIIISDIAIVQEGTYTVTAESPTYCTSSVSKYIIVNPVPMVEVYANPPDATICADESISIFATTNLPSWPPENRLWNGPNGFSSNDYSVHLAYTDSDESGIYTLTVTDSDGCTNSDSINVTIIPLPEVQISSPPNGTVCSGETLFLDVTTNTTNADFLWEGPAGFTSTFKNPSITEVSISNQGGYYVTVTDQSTGCSDYIYEYIHVATVPNANISGNTVICQGESTTLSANGGETYLWSNGSTFSNITVAPLITTQYTVTVTNSYGCADFESTSVTVNSLPALELNTTPVNPVICEGDGTILLCATSNAQNPIYTWSSNGFYSHDQCVSFDEANESGDYIGSVEDGTTGCLNEENISIAINSVPEVNILAVPEPPYCDGINFSLCANSNASNPTYNWIGPNNSTGTGLCVTHNNASELQSGTYSVSITANTGCVGMTEMNVEVGTPLQSVVEYISGGISVSVTGGFPPYIYTLSPGGRTNSTGIFQNLTTGVDYTVDIMDSNDCILTTAVIVSTTMLVSELDISITPNPGKGLFRLTRGDNLLEDFHCVLMDINGFQLKEFNLKGSEKVLNLTNFPVGTYLLRVASDSGTGILRIVLIQ